MTTATRPPCPATWPGPCCRCHPDLPHICDRAADDHPRGLHVCRCSATHRVTEGERA